MVPEAIGLRDQRLFGLLLWGFAALDGGSCFRRIQASGIRANGREGSGRMRHEFGMQAGESSRLFARLFSLDILILFFTQGKIHERGSRTMGDLPPEIF